MKTWPTCQLYNIHIFAVESVSGQHFFSLFFESIAGPIFVLVFVNLIMFSMEMRFAKIVANICVLIDPNVVSMSC